MRPGQNKRMRGRNNRKGPNPLTRSYESNGPDVKIRGTAQHIAEKYLQLARDAQSLRIQGIHSFTFNNVADTAKWAQAILDGDQ